MIKSIICDMDGVFVDTKAKENLIDADDIIDNLNNEIKNILEDEKK